MKKLFYLFAFMMAMGLSACGGDDEPDVKFEDVTLNYEKTYTIPNGGGISWKSSNDLVASVSGSVVKAEHVGTAIISSDKGSFKVTVKPTMNTYPEPCLDWGATMNSVKSFMNSYTGNVTLSKEDNTTLTYQTSTANQKVVIVMYQFENNKLNDSGIVLNSNYITVNNMTDFLLERYVPVSIDESKYRFYFINPEQDMAVLMQLSTISTTIVYQVVYAPVDSSTKSSVNIEELFDIEDTTEADLNSTFEEFKSLL